MRRSLPIIGLYTSAILYFALLEPQRIHKEFKIIFYISSFLNNVNAIRIYTEDTIEFPLYTIINLLLIFGKGFVLTKLFDNEWFWNTQTDLLTVIGLSSFILLIGYIIPMDKFKKVMGIAFIQFITNVGDKVIQSTGVITILSRIKDQQILAQYELLLMFFLAYYAPLILLSSVQDTNEKGLFDSVVTLKKAWIKNTLCYFVSYIIFKNRNVFIDIIKFNDNLALLQTIVIITFVMIESLAFFYWFKPSHPTLQKTTTVEQKINEVSNEKKDNSKYQQQKNASKINKQKQQ